MPLNAIAGSQGSGKSSVLQQLKQHGFKVTTRKTSRSILDEWGVTLSEVNNDHQLTIKFQDEIVKRKFSDDFNTIVGSELVFTERTYADIFTYALVSLGKDNQYSDWLNKYYLECLEYQQVFDKIFYLKAGHFSIERDGVRGDNKHYSTMVDLVMLDYTKQMTHPGKLNVVQTSDLTERTMLIKQQSILYTNYDKNKTQ